MGRCFGLRQWKLGYGLGKPVSSRPPGRSGYNSSGPVRGVRKYTRMWYVIEGYDGADVLSQRLAARADHLTRLTALRDAGRLLVAGPCPAIDAEDPGPAGFSGSVVIAEFVSIEEARAWADADPYVAAGVYARTEVRPFKRVLP